MSDGAREVKDQGINRRKFITMGLIGIAPIIIPGAAWARMRVRTASRAKKVAARALSLYNLPTGERLKTVY